MKTEIKAFSINSEKGKESVANEDFGIVRPEIGFFGIADGFGGKNAGELAAKKILEEAALFVENGLGDSEVTLPFVYRSYYTSQANLLFNAACFANRELCIENKSKALNLRGGASALIAFLDGRKITIANVGSCAAFLVRNGELIELSKPRSYNHYKGYSQVSKNREWKIEWNFPLQAFGILIDLEPEIVEYELQAGDLVILATDGIFPYVNEEVYAQLQNSGLNHRTNEGISEQNQALIERLKTSYDDDDSSMVSICYG